jgi:preprotein translocase subunit SecG
MSLPLAAVPFYMTLVMAIWILSCLALVFIILIQKSKGGGLSAAFGGGGGGSSLFGAKTGDALTWITIGIAGFFLFISVVMGLYYKPTTSVAEPAPQMQQVPGAAGQGQGTQPVEAPATPATVPTAPAGTQPAAPAQPQGTTAVPTAPAAPNGTSTAPAN